MFLFLCFFLHLSFKKVLCCCSDGLLVCIDLLHFVLHKVEWFMDFVCIVKRKGFLLGCVLLSCVEYRIKKEAHTIRSMWHKVKNYQHEKRQWKTQPSSPAAVTNWYAYIYSYIRTRWMDIKLKKLVLWCCVLCCPEYCEPRWICDWYYTLVQNMYMINGNVD